MTHFCRDATRFRFGRPTRRSTDRRDDHKDGEEAAEDGEWRFRPSLSASTPRAGRCGNLEKPKCVSALRPRYRPALSFPSLLGFTRDASAHVPAAVRRHFAPGATGWVDFLAGCAFASAASADVLSCRWHLSHARRKKSRLVCCTESRPVTRRLCNRDELLGVKSCSTGIIHECSTWTNGACMENEKRILCPKCRLWTCVVRLRHGDFRCNK